MLVVVYKIPYRRARAWPSGCIGRVRRASKGILHTMLVVFLRALRYFKKIVILYALKFQYTWNFQNYNNFSDLNFTITDHKTDLHTLP